MASECDPDRSDGGDNDVLEERTTDDLTQLQTNMELDEGRTSKRGREDNREEIWYTVTRNSKKKASKQQEMSSNSLPIQICVTSKEKLPKQFALAKLLQQNEIGEVNKVKYVNPYKLLKVRRALIFFYLALLFTVSTGVDKKLGRLVFPMGSLGI